MEGIEELIEYIKDRYDKSEMDNIYRKKNIKRHTHPIMSEYVENAVAILINAILTKKNKNNDYKYLIDTQLCIENKKGKKSIIRPDIIIYSENNGINTIHGIVEVKSQLGYAGNFKKKDYDEKINRIKKSKSLTSKIRKNQDDIYILKNAVYSLENKKRITENDKKSIEEKKKKIDDLGKDKIYYKVDSNCEDMIVILMTTNGTRNIDKFKGTNFYVLFKDEKGLTWYNTLNKNQLSTRNNSTDKLKNHTFDVFIEYIKKNF